ncbi:cell division protein FtsQ/DivIB [Acidihalobacter prosperus]|uniref:cell division protein FtsQ/DivIB n=1 Tax=Acidihalobacter prosperus TaxID=160660 RepID=UPI0013723D2B|nr:cell division protein FtsQ/DivIB [Acidihalobacter prosperus]
MPAMTSRRRPPSGAVDRSHDLRAGARRWARPLAVLVLLGAVGFGANALRDWLLSPSTLPVRVVRVEGAGHDVSPAQVRRIVAPMLGGGFFGVDLNAVAKALTAIPWVYRANVQRRWPDTLLIRLQPQQPFAYWGKDALLNRQGEVFKPPLSTFPKGLPSLDGPQGKESELMQHYREASTLFSADGLQVIALSEDARRAYRLWFANGIELVIGRDWDMRRMARLAAVYARVLAPRAKRIDRIDLRYPNGFAVAWKHPKTDGATAPAKE